MNYEIDSKDVVRLMLQFMKENNLQESANSLSIETGIVLNTIDNVDLFRSDIHHGRWEKVLPVVSNLSLPIDKLAALYEQVVFELLENNDRDLARELIRTSPPLAHYKTDEPQRYLKLEHLCKKPYFNAADAYEAISKERRRYELAESLISEVSTVPPSRLLAVINQALRYQQANGLLPKGAAYDLFLGGRKAVAKDVDDKVPRRMAGQIKFTMESHPETAAFSPDGQSIITGSADGFIEIWDYETCKLRKDLEYQANDELMMHEEAVITCCFSKDGIHLVTGSQGGIVKIWKLSTGECMRKITAHHQGVTSISFSKDKTQLLTSSYDHLARIHGLKSGKTIKEFRGHTSFVNCAIYIGDGANIMTSSSDGTCRTWDTRTSETLLSFRPVASSSTSIIHETYLMNLLLVPNTPDYVIVCAKNKQAYMVTSQGQLIQKFTAPDTSGDFLSCTLSPHGKFLYCACDDGKLQVFNVGDSTLEDTINVDERELIGIFHHPQRNMLGTMTDQGLLKIWKA